MKLGEVVRYELEHRVRSPSTWVYAAILFVLAFLMMSGAGSPSNAAVHANAPVQLAFLSLILSLFGLVITAGIFADAAVRDVQAVMDPLMFTSPLRTGEYLGGRFLAAAATNAAILLAIPVGFAAPVLLGLGDPAGVGPFRLGAYAQPWLLFLVPNMLFAGAVVFATGILARQTVPVYLAAISLFFVSMFTLGPAGENTGPVWSVTAPLGFHALNGLTEYWTAAERNARLIGFPAHLMWNRLLWLGAAALVLGCLHARFRFAHHEAGGRRRRGRRVLADPGAPTRGTRDEVTASVRSLAAERSFTFRTTARQTFAVARNALAEIAGSRWFAVVLMACTGLTLLWGWNVGDTVFDTSTWPVTLLVAETVLSNRIVLLIYALIALYAGELVWKERDTGAAEIADATPVPEGAALLGRFLALIAMIVMIQTAALLGGILIQVFQGYHDIEFGLYLRVVFGLNLPTFVLVAALAMTVHVLVNHKYLGHGFALLAILAPPLASAIGIRHPLLRYGTDPGWTYSDMNGFGPFVEPFVWFKLYWAAWALLLAVVAVLFGVRGREPGMRHRLREARARFRRPLVRTTGVAVALIVVLGGFIFYNTNVLNEYVADDEIGAAQAEYERRYARYENVAQPTIDRADLRVEIWPDQPAVDMRGSYRLVNRSDVSIDSIHVYLDPAVDAHALSFDREAGAVLADETLGYRIFALGQPLQPGEALQLTFDVAFRPQGFRDAGNPTDVIANGTSFNRSWLPFIGYQPMFELSDGEARQRFGLDPLPPGPDPDDSLAVRFRYPYRDADLVHVNAVIGTAADQIAITTGVLQREWTENGRRYFHYETESPASFGATVFSARYAVMEDRWNDVALRIFHHPGHTENLDRTMRSMKASLEYFTGQFGPYPYGDLRIAEIPRYGGFGSAHPHTIAFTEDYFIARVKDGQVDQPFYGTAHEVAHTWWGGMLRGARVAGAGLLSESLANYSAMMVTEKTYGRDAARRVYDFQMERYLRGRATQSREVPLLEVQDQPYIAYRKGAIALYTLRERIGEEAVNGALRRYADRFRDAAPPYPTSLDLYAELRAATPDSLRHVLTDWFETITLWDLRTERVVVEPTGTGDYVVTLDIVAKKLRADGEGNETEVPLDDLIEIGVFGPGGDDRFGEPIRVERHRIRSGARTIRITVPEEPAWAGIDPFRRLVDRWPDNNVRRVEHGRRGAGGAVR